MLRLRGEYRARLSKAAPRRAAVINIQILRLPQVCKMTGLCRSSIYQMEAEGQFPKRIKIGARSVGGIESEVQSWLRQRLEQSRSLDQLFDPRKGE